MSAKWSLRGAAVLLPVLVLGVFIGMNLSGPASGQAQKEPGFSGIRYSVVQTEGTNVIVTDNKTNTLYFYTVDQGAEPGADLKLRGSLDLTQTGEKVLKPKLYRK
jgi:hypothetical protein